MEVRVLGRSDLRLSLVGLGTYKFCEGIPPDAARKVVHRALDLGITHFDTADCYGGGGWEEVLGDAFGSRRKEIVLATKFGVGLGPDAPPNRGSRDYIVKAVEASLKRLKTDWIDLYTMHVPDRRTPI